MVKVVLLPKLEKECNGCGDTYKTYKEDKKYCEWDCYVENRTHETNSDGKNQYTNESEEKYEKRAKERLKDKIEINENSGCWEWQGGTGWGGYGKFQYKGDHIGAHRASYRMYNGKIKEDNLICHHCDNRKCVNPEHLFQGGHDDNLKDAYEKDRLNEKHLLKRGEENRHAKLTGSDVKEIKRRGKNGEYQKDIAKDFSVGRTAIGKILRGEMWEHVTIDG